MTRVALGGRGRKAPYETEMYRIPSPTKPVVKQLGDAYRRSVENGTSSNGSELLARVRQAIRSPSRSQKYQDKQVEKAIALLKEALPLKPNAGGAIKRKIEEALAVLEA